MAQQVCLERSHPFRFMQDGWFYSQVQSLAFAEEKAQFSGVTLRQRILEKQADGIELFTVLDKMLAYLPGERPLPEQVAEQLSL